MSIKWKTNSRLGKCIKITTKTMWILLKKKIKCTMSEIDQKLGKHIKTITIIGRVKPVRSQQEITM